MTPEEHLENREWMVASLSGEIFGPGGRFQGWKNDLYAESPEIDLQPEHVFENWEDYNRRYVQALSREEILKEESPLRHYGVGILFPDDERALGSEVPDESEVSAEAASGALSDDNGTPKANDDHSPKYEKAFREKAAELGGKIQGRLVEDDEAVPDDETDPSGVGLSRIGKPRGMGVSFAVDLTGDGTLDMRLSGARYRSVEGIRVKKKDGSIPDRKAGKTWWLRVPISATVQIYFNALRTTGCTSLDIPLNPSKISGLEPLNLALSIVSRPLGKDIQGLFPADARLLTATVINRTKKGIKATDCYALFQSRFTVTPGRSDKQPAVLSYPGLIGRKLNEEEESLELLYRKAKVFATGHGCAGDWEALEDSDRAASVIAEPLPCYETPPVTPNLVYPGSDRPFNLFMAPLANLESDDRTGLEPLDELANLYGTWIKERTHEAKSLGARYQAAAGRHLDSAGRCLNRIHAGLGLLKRNDEAWLAFRLTNRAILTQQIAGRLGKRIISYDRNTKRLAWNKDYKAPDPDGPDGHDRVWRPFQIAFLLMSLPGLWDGSSEDGGRDIADLIWFPTGGGKTEAYLAASAFALFARRLNDPIDSGTGVLMRYTLRLLTAQQFQRASGLVCAMEWLRQQMPEKLGDSPFSIGIWVGSDTTPNSNVQSVEALQEAQRDGPDKYAHAILRCPWCGSTMGPRKRNAHYGEHGSTRYICDGLRTSGIGRHRKVTLYCPDPKCLFRQSLPLRVVDEEIYEDPPSLIIGTVDKFAMLAWKPTARSIFGLGGDGKRRVSPPGLIIQDELHLITGPLGSMVGLYEGLIEELCVDHRGPRPVVPKLIASTATTRASTSQIRDLYARENTAIFPPPGLDAGDSFFASYERDKDTRKIKPGRMYLGVLARAYGSGLTVQVRVFSALLAAAARILDPVAKDSFWTLLVFYNSLRELGGGLTLFAADIPERLKDLQRRWHPGINRRFLRDVAELTGRLSNSEVPQAIDKLERTFGDPQGPVDACLASNIIEVGVDVGRLGIMAVAGQPKTMAQYIQATGRVGRERPGLVVVVYANRKARDLSHFEHFRADHARLYAGVEPASVTPFTLQVLERALHGVFVAWLRQQLPEDKIERPVPADGFVEDLRKCALHLLTRMRLLLKNDPAALVEAEATLKNVFGRRLNEWKAAGALVWDNFELVGESGDQPLMRFYGKPCKIEWIDRVWETPTSMRGVDAECPAEIFSPFKDTAETGSDGVFEAL